MKNHTGNPNGTEEFVKSLREKGYRITPQREQMLLFFQHLKRGEHLSAEELHKTLLESQIKISLATLYRSLKFLVENNFLREVDFGEDHKHYELNRPDRNHHHFICNKCGITIEFEEKKVIKCIQDNVLGKKEFEIHDYELKFLGLCRRCKEQNA